MSMYPATPPYQSFNDASGKPLEAGYLYFGLPNQNPETAPVAMYWDDAGTQPAAQPIRTAGGYPVRNGTPTVVYTAGDYSVAVRDSKRALVFYAAQATNAIFANAGGAGLIGFSQTQAYADSTVGKKLQQYVSPVDAPYSADGAGVADAAAKIQQIIDTGTPVIDLAGKTYRIDSMLVFNQPNQRIINGTLRFNGATTTRLANVSGAYVTFENVLFDGNGKQPRGGLVFVDDNTVRPVFKNCSIRNLTGVYYGSNSINGMYGLLISPYGVTNFEVVNCLFKDFLKYNDNATNRDITTGLPSQQVGIGFVGGVCFLPEGLTVPAAAQPVVSRGIIEGCTFDNIQTIRAAGLAISDQIEFNDADAIRTYGQVAGATDLAVTVSNCIFNQVGKRVFKFRAAGSVAHDNVCFATGMQYPMVTAIDLTSNTMVTNLKVYASSGAPVYNGIGWSTGPVFNREALVEGLFVSHCNVGMNFFSDPAQGALDNFKMRGCTFNQCYIAGITQSAPLPTSMTNFVVEDVQIYGGSNNCNGMQILGGAGSPYSVSTGLRLKNVLVVNADVYIQGTDNDIDGLTIEISSNTYAGYSASANLLRIGQTGSAGFQKVSNLFINAWNLASGFLSATRPILASFIGDNGTFSNIRIKVPETLGVTYPHASIWGREMNFDGIQYDGPGRIQVGTENTVNRCTISNAVRLSNNGSACTQQFFYMSNAGSGEVTFNNVIDFRATTAISIEVNTSLGKVAAFNVVSNTSNAAVTSTGGAVITGNVTKLGTFTQAYTLSNVATNRTLDADVISAADLADVVGTLLTDLRAVGFIR